MPFLVRKIEKGKWMQNDILGGQDVSADAITNCLRTKSNALSAWEVADEDQVADAVLAIASRCTSLETIDVIVLGRSDLEEAGFEVAHTEGETALRGAAGWHRDIVGLTYPLLGVLAQLIVKGFVDEQVERITMSKLRDRLRGAVKDGRIDVDALDPNLRAKIA